MVLIDRRRVVERELETPGNLAVRHLAQEPRSPRNLLDAFWTRRCGKGSGRAFAGCGIGC